MDAADPVNKPLVKAWAQWALVWLTFFPLFGVLVSIQFHNPEFLGGTSWFTFGRLRPVHTNGVIFGSFTTAFIGLLYYFLPRLCGVPLYKVEWGWLLLWMWNAFLVLGSLSLLMGYIIGIENAEFEWPLNILRYLVFLGLTIQVLGTIFRRRATRFYVSLWYTLAAAVWTLLNLLIGNVLLPYGPLAGANNAAMWDVPRSNFYTHLGQSSVTLSFMITGFLFWSKLLDGRVQPVDWSRLYLSRIFRLVPLYLLMVIGVVSIALYRAGFRLQESMTSFALHLASWLTFTIPGIAPVNGFAETIPLAGAVWSLPYEWLFYAFLPLGSWCLRAATPTSWVLFSATAVVTITTVMPDVRGPVLYAFGGGIAAASLARVDAIRTRLAHRVWGLVVIACLGITMWLFPTGYTFPALILLTGAFTIIARGNSIYGILEWPTSEGEELRLYYNEGRGVLRFSRGANP